jgi:hypothetical protein
MQGTVILRALGILALAISIAGCHPSMRSAAGQTPPPSPANNAQANSTMAPDQAVGGPADKYIAKTDAKLRGVNFAIWANGRPIGVIEWPGKALDITKDLKGGANVVVVQWKRMQKNGSGTLTLATASRTLLTANVTPSSPATGSASKTFQAARAKVGR